MSLPAAPTPHHPIWKLLDKLAIPVLVIGIIWSGATTFDSGEMRSIILILIGAYGRDFAKDKLAL